MVGAAVTALAVRLPEVRAPFVTGIERARAVVDEIESALPARAAKREAVRSDPALILV